MSVLMCAPVTVFRTIICENIKNISLDFVEVFYVLLDYFEIYL